ncbi:hypothetical protein IFT84_08595 [Rhizobium sp. CFBP 8762]|uniref:hypothetical protein n=1 Tax=Rhizobium sp. CFBP 8762 TaxID=2775279 RepID=UPI001783EC36|nr:hypothetical protein [Rhizobium sp. CFBP 8762]MBD8554586.1 hypothetical protein [Rhizobium sp. CFBP 8762]
MTIERENGNSRESENLSLLFSPSADRVRRSRHPSQNRPDKEVSRLDVACGRLLEEPAESFNPPKLTNIEKICRATASKWRVSNSVALPPRVTDREVNALAVILKTKPTHRF